MAGGARFGYVLLWSSLTANPMGIVIQSMSAKLGIATGMNLPEVRRERLSRRASVLIWVQAGIIAMATSRSSSVPRSASTSSSAFRCSGRR
jgi:manganese transport protein